MVGSGIFEPSGRNIKVVGGNLVGRSGGEEGRDGIGGLGGSGLSLVESLGLPNVGRCVTCAGGCGSTTCIKTERGGIIDRWMALVRNTRPSIEKRSNTSGATDKINIISRVVTTSRSWTCNMVRLKVEMNTLTTRCSGRTTVSCSCRECVGAGEVVDGTLVVVRLSTTDGKSVVVESCDGATLGLHRISLFERPDTISLLPYFKAQIASNRKGIATQGRLEGTKFVET